MTKKGKTNVLGGWKIPYEQLPEDDNWLAELVANRRPVWHGAWFTGVGRAVSKVFRGLGPVANGARRQYNKVKKGKK